MEPYIRPPDPNCWPSALPLTDVLTGEAKITRGYKLPARYVIHTVGPIWKGGNNNEDELLASCYHNSLQLAQKNSIRSIAFPAISCGVYRFPLERAAVIAVRETVDFLDKTNMIQQVVFSCFNDEIFKVYQEILRNYYGT